MKTLKGLFVGFIKYFLMIFLAIWLHGYWAIAILLLVISAKSDKITWGDIYGIAFVIPFASTFCLLVIIHIEEIVGVITLGIGGFLSEDEIRYTPQEIRLMAEREAYAAREAEAREKWRTEAMGGKWIPKKKKALIGKKKIGFAGKIAGFLLNVIKKIKNFIIDFFVLSIIAYAYTLVIVAILPMFFFLCIFMINPIMAIMLLGSEKAFWIISGIFYVPLFCTLMLWSPLFFFSLLFTGTVSSGPSPTPQEEEEKYRRWEEERYSEQMRDEENAKRWNEDLRYQEACREEEERKRQDWMNSHGFGP
jgi:hypothetical protein